MTDDPCNRTLWRAENLDTPSNDVNPRKPYVLANLYGSLTSDGFHAPALDIDYPARLIPSSTPGHFHLYLDKAMPWDDYAKLLKVMGDVGLIEPGYARVALARGMTTLRRPGVMKDSGGSDSVQLLLSHDGVPSSPLRSSQAGTRRV